MFMNKKCREIFWPLHEVGVDTSGQLCLYQLVPSVYAILPVLTVYVKGKLY